MAQLSNFGNKDPIERVTSSGITTRQSSYEVDVLVFATGYDAMTGAIQAINIEGRDGKRLRDVWADGPKSYLGLMVSGFPNLFTITGPGSPSVIGNVLLHAEHHVDFILDLLQQGRQRGKTLDVSVQAQEEWGVHVNDVAQRTLFPKANSWYLGSNIPGKPRVFMPYVGEGYRKTCAQILNDDYRGFIFS